MKKNLFISILSVIAITTITVGVTYAYYQSSATAAINGSAEKGLSSSIAIEAIKTSTNLVPLRDGLIKTAITNNCVDKNNYDVCNLYKVTIVNNAESLYGYLETTDSDYTTNNLKFQMFEKKSDNTYAAVSDTMTASRTANEIVYFKSGADNLVYTSNTIVTTTLYVAIWLSDTDSNQSSDYSKTFDGAIGIELVGSNSDRIKAELP